MRRYAPSRLGALFTRLLQAAIIDFLSYGQSLGFDCVVFGWRELVSALDSY
ncbi:exported hypothetical protein [Cupriavidus taiwanensis]|nr:exported hypothetical protein [Cupriavidus taiwanensis]